MEELYNIARNHFSQDRSLFPGNVDGTRNNNLEWSFTHDVMTTAQVNTVFLVYMHIKNTKMTIDEYVDNPGKGINKSFADKMKPYSFEHLSKGAGFNETLDMLFGLHEYKGLTDKARLKVPMSGFDRVVQAPSILEADKDVRRANIILSQSSNEMSDGFKDNYNFKVGFIRNLGPASENNKIKHETLKNVLVTPDKDRNTNAMLYGAPETDLFCKYIGPSFDRKAYIENNAPDYLGIIDRYETLKNKVPKLGDYPNNDQTDGISQADCALIMSGLAKEVLSAHPEDSNKPEFKALQDKFLSVYDEIQGLTAVEKSLIPTETYLALKKDRDEYLNPFKNLPVKESYENAEKLRRLEPERINERNTNHQKDYDEFNPYYIQQQSLADPILQDGMGTQKYMKYTGDAEKFFEEIEGDAVNNENRIFGPYKINSIGHKSRKILTDKEEYKKANEYLKEKSEKIHEYVAGASSTRRLFASSNKLSALLSDPEQGNFFQAQSENPFLSALASNVGGAGPNIYEAPIVPGQVETVPENVRDYFQANGVKRPLMDIFEHSRDLVLLEYDRQKEVKKGWDISKEAKFLSGLYECNEKIISDYDKLTKFPDELQKPDTTVRNYGNSLSHITGIGVNSESRDLAVYIEGMRWQQIGIKNGWSSRDIHALNLMGIFEGNINKRIYQLEFEGKLDEAKKFKEWHKENLLPMKEKIMSTKVASPMDSLDMLYSIKDFSRKVKNVEFLHTVYASSLKAGQDVLIPGCINACIEDIKKGKSSYYGLGSGFTERIPDKSDLSETMSGCIDSIKAGNLKKETLMEYASLYIYSKSLDGLNQKAHPELFDNRHPDYKAATDSLKNNSQKYVKELLDKFKTRNAEGQEVYPSTNEIVDILKHGDHGPALSEIKDRIGLYVKKTKIQAFCNGKTYKSSGVKSINEIRDIMDDADIGVISFDTRFKEVMNDIKYLDRYRKSMADTINKQYKEGKDIFIRPKDIKEYKDTLESAWYTSSSYMRDKNKKIRKAGGNPKNEQDIDRILGRNGAKRYRAMRQARLTMKNINKTLKDFAENNKFTGAEKAIDRHIKDGFKIDAKNFEQDMIRDKFRTFDDRAREISLNEASYRLKEAELYNDLKHQRAKDLQDNKINKEEFDALSASDKKTYDDKIIASAKKTLLTEAVRGYYTEKANENLLKGTGYEKSMEVINDFERAVNDFTTVGPNGVTFIDDSPSFRDFNDKLLKSGTPFVTHFEDFIKKNSGKSTFKQSDIINFRDMSLGKCLDEATNNEVEKIEKMIKAMGTGVAEKSIESMRQNMATRRVNEAQRANDRAMGL